MIVNPYYLNYINNTQVGGTPCLTNGTIVEKRHLYFVYLCVDCIINSIAHSLRIVDKTLMIRIYGQDG
jgi:hypothetical protein